MFFDLIPYDAPIFTIAYVTFALVVLATFWFAPPRPFRPSNVERGAEGVRWDGRLRLPAKECALTLRAQQQTWLPADAFGGSS